MRLHRFRIAEEYHPVFLVAFCPAPHIVKDFGAKVGNLLVAYNPKTQLFSSAIIGDTGPRDNLGKGSVLLNMELLGIKVPPTNKAETFKLSIENAQVLVAI